MTTKAVKVSKYRYEYNGWTIWKLATHWSVNVRTEVNGTYQFTRLKDAQAFIDRKVGA